MPDLTFSEVNFLNHRKDRADANHNPHYSKRTRKGGRAIDTEAELSRYFSKSRDFSDKTKGGASQKLAQDEDLKHRSERRKQSPQLPVELPDKPFLGFGSSGPGYNSPVTRASTPISFHQERYLSLRDPSPATSTTYFTWSKSRTSPEIRAEIPRVMSSRTEEKSDFCGSKGNRIDLSNHNKDNMQEHLLNAQEERHEQQNGDERSISEFCPLLTEPLTYEQNDSHVDTCTKLNKTKVMDKNASKLKNNTGLPTDTYPDSAPRSQDVDPTKADLLALLASQEYPDIIEAVVDALLKRKNTSSGQPMAGSNKFQSAEDSVRTDCCPNESSKQPTISDIGKNDEMSTLFQERDTTHKNYEDQIPTQITHSPLKADEVVDTSPTESILFQSRSDQTLQGDLALPKGSADPVASSAKEHKGQRTLPYSYRPESTSAWTGYDNIFGSQVGQDRYFPEEKDVNQPRHFDRSAKLGEDVGDQLYDQNKASAREAIPSLNDVGTSTEPRDFNPEVVEFQYEPELDRPTPWTYPGYQDSPEADAWGIPQTDEIGSHSLRVSPLQELLSPPDTGSRSEFLGGQEFVRSRIYRPSSPWTRPTTQGSVSRSADVRPVSRDPSAAVTELERFWKPHRLY